MEKDNPPAKAINLLINFCPAFKVVTDIRQVNRLILAKDPLKYENK